MPTCLVPSLAALAANRPGNELLFLPDRDRGQPDPKVITLRDATAIAEIAETSSARSDALELEPEYLARLAEQLAPEQLGELIQGLFDVMKAKAAQVGPRAIKPRSALALDRSESKPAQVCGPLRNHSADASSIAFSDGE